MADGITQEEMSKLFEKFFGAPASGSGSGGMLDTKNIEEFKKQLQESTKEMKKALPFNKQLTDVLKGNRAQYTTVDKELEKLDEAIRDATEAHTLSGSAAEAERIATMEATRAERAKAVAIVNTRATLQNFGAGVTNLADELIKGVLGYAKDLQRGATGVESGTNAAVNSAKLLGNATETTGNVVSGVGSIMGIFGGTVGKVGKALAVFGDLLGIFGKKSAEYAAEAAQFLGTELGKTQKAYKEVTDTGAVLAGGMTELRQRAADAGLDVSQFASVVRASKDDLSQMGMGLGEATKRLGGVSKEIRTSDIGGQLYKLGYSFEEQASLGAQVAANLNASGRLRSTSDKEVATMTAQYGKDLKVLGDITGADAKKKMEEARARAQEADLLAEAMAKGGPAAVEKLQRQLATMPESMKKGYMEFVSTGGTAIADAATNVAITQNPKILGQYQQMFQTLSDTNVDASKAQDQTAKLTEQTAKYQKENLDQTRVTGMAARLGGDGILRGTADITNSLIMVGNRLGEGATDAAREAADAAAKNAAPLDQAVTQLEVNTQRLKAAMGEELTKPITAFADTMAKGVSTVREELEKMGLRPKGTNEKFGEAAGGAAGSITAGAIGAGIGSVLLPGIGTFLGGMLGSALGGYFGSKGGGAAGKMIDEYAVGGIVDRPQIARVGEGGMPEAIIPLPNGRSVPLDLDPAAFAESIKESIGIKNPTASAVTPPPAPVAGVGMGADDFTAKEHVALLRDIKEILTSSHSVQEQFVQNTYQ